MFTSHTLFKQLLNENDDSSENTKLIPAFKSTEIKEVQFSESPLSSAITISKLSKQEFETIVATQRGIPAYTWTNSSFIPAIIQKEYTEIKKLDAIPGKQKMHYKDIINNTLPYVFVICDMGTNGLGLFTKSEIPATVDITHYSGEIRQLPSQEEELSDRYWQTPVHTKTSYLFNQVRVKNGRRIRITTDKEVVLLYLIDVGKVLLI